MGLAKRRFWEVPRMVPNLRRQSMAAWMRRLCYLGRRPPAWSMPGLGRRIRRHGDQGSGAANWAGLVIPWRWPSRGSPPFATCATTTLFLGPHALIGWNDPSRSGDHYAISRYCAAFSLQFQHLARVIGVFPAHIALGTMFGILWGFGVRQGIHSIILTNRALRFTKGETEIIKQVKAPYGQAPPVYLQALARRNREVKWSMRYGMVLDASATLGSLTLGVGILFRHPLIGAVSTALTSAALPVLTGAFFPLVLPSVVATVERSTRCALSFRKTRAVRRHLATLSDPRADTIGKLYERRQHELARYFALDAAARGGLVAGATLSVFVGPGGLLLLVPATLGVLASECFAGRYLNVDDTFPLKERLTMRNDGQYFDAILKSNWDVQSLEALRRARSKRYPPGWTSAFFRPALWVYRRYRGDRQSDTNMSAQVLAAFDHRNQSVSQGPVPNPSRVMDIIDDGRVRSAFAERILHRRRLREALRGHGVTIEGKKWSVDADALAMHMTETRWNTTWSQDVVDELYQLAEEVLLTQGKVEHWRRLRALLDGYGRFARASLRNYAASQRVPRQRKDS